MTPQPARYIMPWKSLGGIEAFLITISFTLLLTDKSDAVEFYIAKICILAVCLIAAVQCMLVASGRRGVMPYIFTAVICGVLGVVGLFLINNVNEKRAAKLKASRNVPLPPEPPVYADFKPIYERHKDKLGNPRPEEPPIIVYQAKHDNAMVIAFDWVDESRDFCVLDDKVLDGKSWSRLKVIHGDLVPEDNWYFDADNRKRTRTPKGKDPPYGAIAMAWIKDPEKWEREVGWRMWHGVYTAGSVHVQRFDRGLIVGDLRHIKGG